MPSGARFDSDKVRKNLKSVKEKIPNEIARALYIELEIGSKEVKRRTPVDEGELRASIHVQGPFIVYLKGRRVIYGNVVAGGPSAPYAIYVHEDLDAQHKVGQAKFLESWLLESRPNMAARVARRVQINRALA
jgi:hypothetical protein